MRRNGHVVTRVRVRRRVVYARAQTVLQTETIKTPTGTRVVTRPVTRYHVIYRKHVITMTSRANSSHVGSCLSMADILAILYGKVLRFDAKRPATVRL